MSPIREHTLDKELCNPKPLDYYVRQRMTAVALGDIAPDDRQDPYAELGGGIPSRYDDEQSEVSRSLELQEGSQWKRPELEIAINQLAMWQMTARSVDLLPDRDKLDYAASVEHIMCQIVSRQRTLATTDMYSYPGFQHYGFASNDDAFGYVRELGDFVNQIDDHLLAKVCEVLDDKLAQLKTHYTHDDYRQRVLTQMREKRGQPQIVFDNDGRPVVIRVE